jgi:hypothetical protein
MRFASCVVLVSVGLFSGCGQKNHEPIGQSLSATEAIAETKSDVPKALEKVVGHEICSGKVTEEWKNPANGQNVRQIWERRAQFADFSSKKDGFSIGYKLTVNTQNYHQGSDGNWEPAEKRVYDSTLTFVGVWSEPLSRYVGYLQWVGQNQQGEPVDVVLKSPLKVTSYAVSGDTVTMKYMDTVPVQASGDSPSHMNVYEETLRLNGSKLERNWSYKNFNYDPVTLSPTTDLNIGAQPSFDTEEKCSL